MDQYHTTSYTTLKIDGFPGTNGTFLTRALFRCNIFRKLASKEADFKQSYYNNGLKYKIYNNGLKYKICIAKLFQQFMGFSGFDHLYR